MLSYFTIVALLVVAALQILMVRQMAFALRKIRLLEDRANRSGELFTLLTEACSGGFTSMAQELARVADDAPVVPRPRVSAHRLRRAVSNGASIDEVAAAEQLAEGEVRLRLFLDQAKGASKRKEKVNGSLRAS